MFYQRNHIYYIIASVLLVLGSCIHNDLPYPRIQQNIRQLAAVGESRPAVIDSTNLNATVYLDEEVDIENVQFRRFEVSEGGIADPDLLEGTYDLSKAMVVNITLYQTYQWLIRAEQPIERYFTIEGQIGETTIDAVAHRVLVDVPEAANLSRLRVTSIKLGAKGVSVMTPDISVGEYDFSRPVRVAVTAFGRTEEWTIYVEKTEVLVSTSRVDPWSQVIWAYGSCQDGMKGGFQYRKSDSPEWITVDASRVVQTQGAFSCSIPHLEPETEYVVRAVADDEVGNEVHVTTQGTEMLPNGDFENWWLDGKIWCPWSEGATQWTWPNGGSRFWDTGNKGAATLGESNVKPSDYVPAGLTGKSAELKTEFKGVGIIGKLAAGSIYTGSYQRTDGTNGVLDFGREWKVRPTKLRGYYHYTNGPIDNASSEMASLKGERDTCSIYIALTNWKTPYEIRTNPKNRQLFDKNADYVIGYGQLERGTSMDSYEPFEINIEYRSTSEIPSYIMVTCASSKYGDFFTGSTSSVLYVDQLSLDYDY